MYRHQLLPDGPDQQRGNDGTVHAAGEGKQHFFTADLLPDGLNLLFDKGLGQFGSCNPFHAVRAPVRIHVLSSVHQSSRILPPRGTAGAVPRRMIIG